MFLESRASIPSRSDRANFPGEVLEQAAGALMVGAKLEGSTDLGLGFGSVTFLSQGHRQIGVRVGEVGLEP